jgi:hypothetical protein
MSGLDDYDLGKVLGVQENCGRYSKGHTRQIQRQILPKIIIIHSATCYPCYHVTSIIHH